MDLISPVPLLNEACATCGRPFNIHKTTLDEPSTTLHPVWGNLDSCLEFKRCTPPKAAYGEIDFEDNYVCIGGVRYPLVATREGRWTEDNPLGDGSVVDFRARIVDNTGQSRLQGPSIEAWIYPMCGTECDSFRRVPRPCNCGRKDMWKELVTRANIPFTLKPESDVKSKTNSRRRNNR